MDQNTTEPSASEPLRPGSVLALAKGHMPAKFAERFLADDLIIFKKPWKGYTDEFQELNLVGQDRNRASEAISHTAGLCVLSVIGACLLCKCHHLLPRALKLLAIAIWIFILLCAINKYSTVQSICSRIRARYTSEGLYDYGMKTFASLIHDPARTQWFWFHGKVPLGPMKRREKHLNDGWIILRLARWPEDDASSSSGEQGVEQSRSVAKDWERCVVAMQLYRDMKKHKIPPPITCSVSGLERSAESQKEDGKWLFVEVNPSQRWWPVEVNKASGLFMAGDDESPELRDLRISLRKMAKVMGYEPKRSEHSCHVPT